MAFFKKNKTSAKVSERELVKEAIAYFLVLMIYADGEADDSEVASAMGVIGRSYLFTDNEPDEDYNLLVRMEAKMNEDLEGHGTHYANVLAQSDWKFTAAAMMCDVMCADGAIDEGEEHVLREVAVRAGITEPELDGVFSVVFAMRRGWG